LPATAGLALAAMLAAGAGGYARRRRLA